MPAELQAQTGAPLLERTQSEVELGKPSLRALGWRKNVQAEAWLRHLGPVEEDGHLN